MLAHRTAHDVVVVVVVVVVAPVVVVGVGCDDVDANGDGVHCFVAELSLVCSVEVGSRR